MSTLIKAVRKQRMTKSQVMELVDWMLEHEEECNNATNGRIAQMYEDDTGITVSTYVIKNNRNKWIKVNDKVVKKEFYELYQSIQEEQHSDSHSEEACELSNNGDSESSNP